MMCWKRRPASPATTATLLFAAAFALVASPLVAAKRDMGAIDLLDLPQLGDPQFSPDGRLALYTLEQSSWAENERVSDLWMQPENGEQVRLTADDYDEKQPRFTPDGKAVSFVSKRKGDKSSQLYLLTLGGKEPRRISSHGSAVRSYAWAPDGNSVYFLADAPLPRDLVERRRLRDDMVAYDEDVVRRHVWRLDVASGAIVRVTPERASVGAFDLSRDGALLAYHVRSSARIDDRAEGEIWAQRTRGGAPWQVTRNAHSEDNLEIAPDNSAILFTADVNGAGEPYYDSNLFLVPVSGGAARLLQGDATFEVEDAHWGRNAHEIFIRANMGVHSELVRVDPRADRAKPLTDGVHTMTAWSYAPAADRHAMIFRSHSTPADFFSLGRGKRAVRQWTRIGADAVAGFRLPRQERIRFKAADGQEVEALLNYPLDYKPGQRYPLAVYSHGGPRSSDQYGLWQWRSYQPLLAARGWVFLTVNYRGSRGYGDAFMRDMLVAYFNNSHTDVLAGIDHVVAMGVADPERLAAFGWSAGGHMTAKLITVTDRFKAASSGAGAVEWTSMTGESDVSHTRALLFGGRPWLKEGPIERYVRESPLFEMWKARTPTLIFVGEADERVPPSQSKMLHRALRDNGVETRLYIAPREPHSFGELRHRLFKINAELEWFERHVNGRTYVFEPAPPIEEKPLTDGVE